MNQELRDRVAKVYALVNHGATEGERTSAKNQLDRMLKKHKLEGIDLDSIDQTKRYFTYTTVMEEHLFGYIVEMFAAKREVWKSPWMKKLDVKLTHVEYVKVDCAYEYFRRHMKVQWNLVCADDVKRKRKVKTRNARRKELQEAFMNRYFIDSGLVPERLVITIDSSKLSDAEKKDRLKMMDIEAGQFKTQVQTGHQLPPAQLPKKQGQLSIF